jgi:hypothetical protein
MFEGLAAVSGGGSVTITRKPRRLSIPIPASLRRSSRRRRNKEGSGSHGKETVSPHMDVTDDRVVLLYGQATSCVPRCGRSSHRGDLSSPDSEDEKDP